MMAVGRLRYSADTAAADWIAPRLRGFARCVASVVPEGFEA